MTDDAGRGLEGRDMTGDAKNALEGRPSAGELTSSWHWLEGFAAGAEAMRQACIVNVYDSPWQPHVTQNIALRLQAIPIPAEQSEGGPSQPNPATDR